MYKSGRAIQALFNVCFWTDCDIENVTQPPPLLSEMNASNMKSKGNMKSKLTLFSFLINVLIMHNSSVHIIVTEKRLVFYNLKSKLSPALK